MGNPITHNREDAKKNIITSIRKATKNRRDMRCNQRKTSRPFMRKMIFFGVAMSLAIWTSADYMLHRRLQCHQHVSDRTRHAHN